MLQDTHTHKDAQGNNLERMWYLLAAFEVKLNCAPHTRQPQEHTPHYTEQVPLLPEQVPLLPATLIRPCIALLQLMKPHIAQDQALTQLLQQALIATYRQLILEPLRETPPKWRDAIKLLPTIPHALVHLRTEVEATLKNTNDDSVKPQAHMLRSIAIYSATHPIQNLTRLMQNLLRRARPLLPIPHLHSNEPANAQSQRQEEKMEIANEKENLISQCQDEPKTRPAQKTTSQQTHTPDANEYHAHEAKMDEKRQSHNERTPTHDESNAKRQCIAKDLTTTTTLPKGQTNLRIDETMATTLTTKTHTETNHMLKRMYRNVHVVFHPDDVITRAENLVIDSS